MKNEKCIKCDLFKFLENYIKGFKNYSQKFKKFNTSLKNTFRVS